MSCHKPLHSAPLLCSTKSAKEQTFESSRWKNETILNIKVYNDKGMFLTSLKNTQVPTPNKKHQRCRIKIHSYKSWCHSSCLKTSNQKGKYFFLRLVMPSRKCQKHSLLGVGKFSNQQTKRMEVTAASNQWDWRETMSMVWGLSSSVHKSASDITWKKLMPWKLAATRLEHHTA